MTLTANVKHDSFDFFLGRTIIFFHSFRPFFSSFFSSDNTASNDVVVQIETSLWSVQCIFIIGNIYQHFAYNGFPFANVSDEMIFQDLLVNSCLILLKFKSIPAIYTADCYIFLFRKEFLFILLKIWHWWRMQ